MISSYCVNISWGMEGKRESRSREITTRSAVKCTNMRNSEEGRWTKKWREKKTLAKVTAHANVKDFAMQMQAKIHENQFYFKDVTPKQQKCKKNARKMGQSFSIKFVWKNDFKKIYHICIFSLFPLFIGILLLNNVL